MEYAYGGPRNSLTSPAVPNTSTSPHMNFGRFVVLTGLQLGIAIGAFHWIAPAALGHELRNPWAVLAMAFAYGVPLSLFEYLYHRYLLHAAVLPFLRSMNRAHTLHHKLTAIKASIRGSEPDRLVEVRSEFPIEHAHQDEAMEFPFYSVSIFLAVFVVLMGLPTKLLLPQSPAILSLLIGVTLYYSAYEVWHAVLHMPFDTFWSPAMRNPVFGGVVKRIYSFHLMHHWRPNANLAIVGLWGFAVWDHAFGTHRRPERIPLDGARVSYNDAAIRRPRWPIAVLDRWLPKSHKWSRRAENWAARVFLRRKANG